MKKNLFFAAIALVALAGCTSDDFVGDKNLQKANENGAISFGFDVPAVTRAEGKAAATALNNQFIVYGEKNEADRVDPAVTGTGNAAATVASGRLVFPNYLVNWVDNSAYTTTSNTKNWEYVGTSIGAFSYPEANIKIKDGGTTTNASSGAQTIKYWDYSASNYVFTAVSANHSDIETGKVIITKNASDATDIYGKGYSITVTDMASLTDLYFSDRVDIAPTANQNRDQANAYGGNVRLTFRNAISQVRVGMYETISGYDVKIDNFYVDAGRAAPTFDQMSTASTTNFKANLPNFAPDLANSKTSVAGTFTVKYYEKNSTNDAAGISNQPTVSFDGGSKANVLTLGTGITDATKLNDTSSEPTFDRNQADPAVNGIYTVVFPMENNTTNLKLKIDYTLSNSVSGEKIEVKGATAEIPSQYLQWKPNYKYTYLFKISQDTNGSTGQGVVGLYPITFDAVVIAAADGTAEYITTVSEPSITTFGVNSSTGKYVSGGNDYAASTTVYAVVEQGSVLQTLSSANMKLYTVTTSDATNFPITEASVAEALIEAPRLNAAEATAAKIKLPTNPELTYQNTVPAEDGSTITLDATYNKAATFTTATGTKYALVYEKTAATYTYDSGNTYTSDDFTAAGKLYTRTGELGSYTYTLAESWSSGTTYYKPTAVSSKGEYAVKIVTCP